MQVDAGTVYTSTIRTILGMVMPAEQVTAVDIMRDLHVEWNLVVRASADAERSAATTVLDHLMVSRQPLWSLIECPS